MSLKKIAVDARMIKNSGIGTVLANILERWIPKARETIFYLLGDPEILGSYPWAGNEYVKLISCKVPIYSIKEQVLLPRAVPADADLLWVPHYNIPLLYRGKLLVTVHDVFHLDMAGLVPGIHRRLYARLMFAAVAAKADKIICVSRFTEERLRHFEPNLPQERTCVIYNGVDRFWCQAASGKSVAPKPYMLFVGNVKPHKNLSRLLRAFGQVMDRISHDLLIVGKKEGFIVGDGAVQDMAAGLGKRVHFTGHVSDEELRSLYSGAGLFVFPTLYEGFGLPPLEALAAGCRRLLLSDIPVLREIYGETACYVSPHEESAIGEGIISALGSGPVPEEAVAGLLKKFGWEEAALKVEVVAESLISPDR